MQHYRTFLPSTLLGLWLLSTAFFYSKSNPTTTESACQLFVPNVFSPNGDGTNDFFLPQTNPGCSVMDYQLIIMDRWGGVLFQSNNINEGWNGAYEGQDMEEGTYVYNIEYTFNPVTDTLANRTLELKHGEINLVR